MPDNDVPPPPFRDFDAKAELQRVIKLCAREARTKGYGRPRWSIVGRVTGHGSGYSYSLCVWAAVDPDELCVRA